MTTHPHNHTHSPEHAHPHADIVGESAAVTRIQRLAWFLEAHFGDVELHMPEEGDEAEPDDEENQPSLLVTARNLLHRPISLSWSGHAGQSDLQGDLPFHLICSLAENVMVTE